MKMLELLQQKRAVLVAQRDQLLGQYNMTHGAILVIDETIAEHKAATEAAALEAAKAEQAAKEAAEREERERLESDVPKAIEQPRVTDE
jgi:peptidoglycan hydrolase CwlO-like protein